MTDLAWHWTDSKEVRRDLVGADDIVDALVLGSGRLRVHRIECADPIEDRGNKTTYEQVRSLWYLDVGDILKQCAIECALLTCWCGGISEAVTEEAVKDAMAAGGSDAETWAETAVYYATERASFGVCSQAMAVELEDAAEDAVRATCESRLLELVNGLRMKQLN